MCVPEINRLSGRIILALSLIALLCVASGYFQPQSDEGSAAHIFQLSIVALIPMGLFFVATVDRDRPWQSLRRLVVPAAVLAIAFAALYRLEHWR